MSAYRHPQADPIDVTSQGIRQMKRLATELEPHVQSRGTRVLTSTERRAHDGGLLLAAALGLPESVVSEHVELCDDERGSNDSRRILDLIAAHQDVDVLILVVHMARSKTLPLAYAEMIGRIIRHDSHLGNGKALLIFSDGRKEMRLP